MKELWNKYNKHIIIAGLLIALLLVSTCSHTKQSKLEGENKILTEQLGQLKDSIVKTENERKIESDSLTKVNDEKEAANVLLREKDNKNKEKIASLENKLEKTRKEVATYNSSQIAESLNIRYKTNTTTATDSTFTGTEDTGQKIIIELYEKDVCEETVSIKDEQLRDKDEIIKNVTEQRDNEHTKNLSAEKSIDMFKEYAEKADKIRLNDKKIIRNLKTQKTVQWILIPAAFVGGYLIAK